MQQHVQIARALATAFLQGEFAAPLLARRGERVLGRKRRWMYALAERVVKRFGDGARPRHRDVVQVILGTPRLAHYCDRDDACVVAWPNAPHVMRPLAAAASWRVPSLCNTAELADWLGVSIRHLEWFTDSRPLRAACQHESLRHYRYRILAKRFGQVRLIEAPKPRLKEIQRQILAGILDRVPPHVAAHGFHAGRSIRTFAAPHVGQQAVLKIDLQDFFPSITAPRVHALFRSIGYTDTVATLLTGLCTHRTPEFVWSESCEGVAPFVVDKAERLYAQRHLPQGAPTSPAIANLCAFRLDSRLASLARAATAHYTRYADDLAFSGGAEFARSVRRFQHHASAAILEAGFQPHFRKTRIMRPGVRQQLVGLVVNDRLNVRRADYDGLKATLTNCVRHGPASQNRSQLADFRAHLIGRVSFVESIHPERGRRLRLLLNQILW